MKLNIENSKTFQRINSKIDVKLLAGMLIFIGIGTLIISPFTISVHNENNRLITYPKGEHLVQKIESYDKEKLANIANEEEPDGYELIKAFKLVELNNTGETRVLKQYLNEEPIEVKNIERYSFGTPVATVTKEPVMTKTPNRG